MSHRKIPHITLGTVRQVRDSIGVDLLRAYQPEVQAVLHGDPIAVGRIVHACGGPAEVSGDDLAEWSDALMVALVEFFPKRSVFDDFAGKGEHKIGGFDPWKVVFRATGMIGHEPWGYSFRELIWAAQGAYEPHAERIALEINKVARRGKSTHPETVNPWHPRRPRPTRTRGQHAAEPSTS